MSARNLTVRISCFRPLPNTGQTDVFDLNPHVTALTITTARAGGFQAMTVGLEPDTHRQRFYRGSSQGRLPRSYQVMPFGHVVAKVGRAVLFEGRVVHLSYRGGQLVGFVAHGYGFSAMQDDWSDATSGVSQTSGQILRTLVPRIAPLIRLAGAQEFIDPGVSHTLTEFRYMTLAQALDKITKEGGTLTVDGIEQAVPWDAAVWEGRRLHLAPRILEGEPLYRIPLDETVTWDADYSEVWGEAAVAYRSGSSETTNARNANPAFAVRYDGARRSTLVATEQMTSAAANQFRDTYLANHFQPAVRATVTRDGRRGLERSNGRPVPAYLVQARMDAWLQAADQRPLPIVATSWDGLSGEVTPELGEPSPELPRNWMASSDESRRHLIRKTDILTGSRR